MINAGTWPFETRGEGHRGSFVLPESSSRHTIQICEGERDRETEKKRWDEQNNYCRISW